MLFIIYRMSSSPEPVNADFYATAWKDLSLVTVRHCDIGTIYHDWSEVRVEADITVSSSGSYV